MTNNAIYLSKTASIPFEDRFRNVVLLGPPSSKKREKVIIPMIRQDVEYNKDAGMLVLDADGALSGAAAQMAKQAERPFLFVDPSRDNCPFFNPMVGEESEVIDDLLTVFGDLLADLPPYIRAVNEILLSNAIKVLKRLDREEGVDGKYATFLNLNILLRNINQGGRKLVQMLSQTQKGTDADVKENADIATWFINEYYAENSKTYDNAAYVRAQVSGITQNKYLRNVLAPDADLNKHNEINFEDLMRKRIVVAVSANKRVLGDRARLFGALLLLKYQRAAFFLAAVEPEPTPQFLYVDEFHEFAMPELRDLFIESYRLKVASAISFQAWANIERGGREYKHLRIILMANLRNSVPFPGLSKNDAKYYAEDFSVLSRTPKAEVLSDLFGLQEGHFIHMLLYGGNVQSYEVSKADLA